MNTLHIFKKLYPFILNYRGSLILALLLTTIGALLSQVTPLVMEYSVNTVQDMIDKPVDRQRILVIVGTLVAILLGKEILSLLVTLGQKFLSDRIRFRMAGDLYDYTIQRITSYHLSFFALSQNQTVIW